MVRLVGACPSGVRVSRPASATTLANLLHLLSWSTWVSYIERALREQSRNRSSILRAGIGSFHGPQFFWPPGPHTHSQTPSAHSPPFLLFLPHPAISFLSSCDPVCPLHGRSPFEPDCGASPGMYDASPDHEKGSECKESWKRCVLRV